MSLSPQSQLDKHSWIETFTPLPAKVYFTNQGTFQVINVSLGTWWTGGVSGPYCISIFIWESHWLKMAWWSWKCSAFKNKPTRTDVWRFICHHPAQKMRQINSARKMLVTLSTIDSPREEIENLEKPTLQIVPMKKKFNAFLFYIIFLHTLLLMDSR